MQKVQKLESINIQSDCGTTSKKRTDSSCVSTRGRKVGKMRVLIQRMIKKQHIKNEQIKRKQT